MGSPQVFPMLPALLYMAQFLPAVRCNNNLLCYYSPFMYRNQTFNLTMTECTTTERCMKGNGRYGNHNALSTRGCMGLRDCGQTRPLRLKGTTYNVTYLCCDYNYCNAGLCVTVKSLPFVVAITYVLLTVL
ncbi:hypothetical protein UPYG_G00270540 [Umbra pygmaea]|uniref:UPAR/Ly6 domain-containing protein n=1 Tax=Umbra pygmaea TaxID=75934 RepID=A0ABD0WV30_UMBPY